MIDHGPGVRPQRHAIFRRFWQGGREANKGGAGLGLDIAARTVVAHGGVISVEEAPEGGAVFTMQFEIAARGREPLAGAGHGGLTGVFIRDCDLLAAVSRL